MKKPKILITNDDGIHAPGLYHLSQALKDMADLFIVAPDDERSGSSIGISLIKPLEIWEVSFPGNIQAWKVSGTPADCVKMALLLLLEGPPDMIVSGINPGANAGHSVLYSGTLGGVIEGAFQGIPGIGFSAVEETSPKYESFYPFIPPLVQHFLDEPLPKGTILNINFPKHDVIRGLKMARQGIGPWTNEYEEIHLEDGKVKYQLTGKWADEIWHEESDCAFLEDGHIAVVPIRVHELTCDRTLQERKESLENQFKDFFSL